MTELLRRRGEPWLPASEFGPETDQEAPLPVLLVAAHPIVRSGLRQILNSRTDLDLVAEADSAENARILLSEAQPRVVLLAPEQGLEEIGELTALAAQAEVPVLLVYGSSSDPAFASDLQVAGALPAEATAEQIAAALHAVALGLSVGIARPRLATPSSPDERASDDPLTDREMQVLQLIAGGLPNKGIARRLNISEHTVKFHVGSILSKLGAASRTEAVTLAAHRGLLTL